MSSLRNHLTNCLQVKEADILVSAIGKPGFVEGSWIKPGAVVIDVGTNYIAGEYSLKTSQAILLTSYKMHPRNPGSVWSEMLISSLRPP